MATERKIGRDVYRCEKLPADQALGLFLRVTRFFRSAPDMMASISAGQADVYGGQTFLVLALNGDEADHEASQKLLVDLAQLCRVGSDQCVVGVKPQDLGETIQVAWFAMEVQFRDFLSGSMPPDDSPGQAAAETKARTSRTAKLD